MTTATPPPAPPNQPPAWEAPPTAPTSRPPLRRSGTDRMLGGVCGGLAEYTGVDAVLWRIGLVALAVAGGSGVLVYLLLWLFMPGDRGGDPAVASWRPHRKRGAPVPRSALPRVTIAVLLIVIGVLALLARFTGFDPGPRGFLGAALLVVGLGLVAAAFAHGRRARSGLIVLGLLLSLALITASTSVPWHSFGTGIGDRTYRPTTAADVAPYYRGGVGDMTVDLTRVDLAGLDRTITTHLEHGVGNLEVLVPSSADVQVRVANGVGNVDAFDGSSDGGYFPGTGAEPWAGDGHAEFDLIINAGIGDVEVHRA